MEVNVSLEARGGGEEGYSHLRVRGGGLVSGAVKSWTKGGENFLQDWRGTLEKL